MSRLRLVVILILGTAAVLNLSRTLIEIYGSTRRLEDAKTELEELKDENLELQGELDYSQTTEFIEKEAREKLNMIFPDEKLVLVADTSSGTGQNIENDKDNVLGEVDSNIPVWKQWIGVLWK